MKPILTSLAIVLCATALFGQDLAGVSASHSRAVVAGIVTKDPDSQPVKKALIELIAENQSQGGDYTAVTGADGSFRIQNVIPGRYHLFAERSGLLDVDRQRTHSDGRVLTLTAGQELKDVHIRLQAAAVIRGRVTDEDGEPMQDAEVTVLQQTFASGHSHWQQTGGERTNDLGEFRIANLPPGNFYVSVNPPPDLKALIESAGRGSVEGRPAEKSGAAYQTTYYPGTNDRAQALAVQLHPGDDFPVNFSLTPGPSLTISGSVVNLPPRTSATIMLQSRDFNIIQSGAEIHKDGSFVIRDVSPGSYTITASVDGFAVPMTARQALQVGSASVDGLRLSPQPGATLRGHLRLDGAGNLSRIDPVQIFLTLQSSDDDSGFTMGDRFTNLAHVTADGSFVWNDVPPGNYYVQLLGDTGRNENWFIKSVLIGGRDVNDSGVNVNGGAQLMEVVINAMGGIVGGAVLDSNGQPTPNATVVAVPESRFRGRIDRYRKTVTDQSGHFSLHGIRPGEYTVFAWESVDGDAYFNPEFLKSFEGRGTGLRVGEGDRKTLELRLIPETDQQP
jgi:protocatechuate 3,4-dioxygenase beta subunit